MSTPTDQPEQPVASDQPDPGTTDEGLDRDPDEIPNAPNRDRHDEPATEELVNQTDAAEEEADRR